MKKPSLQSQSVTELIAAYERIGIQQDDALLADKMSTYNKLYKAQRELMNELRSRGFDSRAQITKFLDHPNIQVRLHAAIDSLVVAPEAARAVLQEIRLSRIAPQCIDAGFIIIGLDDGSYTPK